MKETKLSKPFVPTDKVPKKFVKDDELYFTDNGRVLCGKHCGMSAAFTDRDISGQKIARVMPQDVARWLANLGFPLECETCALTKSILQKA